ncbi:adenylyltransferase/cytidyltransferase family protein [Parablautia intestinalis]|nr:adenylyltransferase/cytidyltransferase family protein [Parablautia intestinalis]
MNRDEWLLKELKKNIVRCFSLKKNAKIMIIVSDYDRAEHLFDKSDDVFWVIRILEEFMCAPYSQLVKDGYDFIFAIEVIETCKNPIKMIQYLKKLLAEDGKLIIGAENRLGIKYFCGEKEPFMQKVFVGIEDYQGSLDSGRKGRLYAKNEIEEILKKGGFERFKFYSVFPDLEHIQVIFSEDYLPQEDMAIRIGPMYNCPDTVFAHEEKIFTSLIHNKIFHQMANAFLIECGKRNNLEELRQITFSTDRGQDKAMATMMYKDIVIKTPIYPQGRAEIEQLLGNTSNLQARGIHIVEAKTRENGVIMPFIQAELANVYLQRLLEKDVDSFIIQMEKFLDYILKSSDIISIDSELGPLVKNGYVDLVPLNSFVIDNDFVFFDQEFCIVNYPVHAIMFRAIAMVYMYNDKREEILPSKYFMDKYGIRNDSYFWQKISDQFTDKLTNQEILGDFYKLHRRNYFVVEKNRERLNSSITDYENIVLNPFQNLYGKKLFIFGAGNFAKKFIAMYKHDYLIEGILDNDSCKWGNTLEGYPIMNPTVLKHLKGNEYKVIICIKNYQPIYTQLVNMGVINIGTYDMNRVYPGRQALAIPYEIEKDKIKKRYHIGYIAGVFDLYHLGHLNMFRRAKELCDYLIVGVVSDAGVRHFKNAEPYVPFEERIDLVRACRYVDEAVEIPFFFRGTVEAFEKYHFDVQFSGSDYTDNPGWSEMKKYLNAHGAEMVFFPYTKQTSSTKLKRLIDKGLL